MLSPLLMQKKTGFADYTYAGTQLLMTAQSGALNEYAYSKTPVAGSGVTIDSTNTLFGAPAIGFAGTGQVTLTNPRGYSQPDPGTSDFTVDAQLNVTNILLNPANNAYIWPVFIWGGYFAGTTPVNMALYYLENSSGVTGGEWVFIYKNASTGIVCPMPNKAVITRNVYHHFAVVRRSNQLCMFLDGVPIMTPVAFTDTVSYVAAKDLYLGRCDGGTGNVQWYAVGDIAAFRICKQAKYWGNFVPPSGLFPTS